MSALKMATDTIKKSEDLDALLFDDMTVEDIPMVFEEQLDMIAGEISSDSLQDISAAFGDVEESLTGSSSPISTGTTNSLSSPSTTEDMDDDLSDDTNVSSPYNNPSAAPSTPNSPQLFAQINPSSSFIPYAMPIACFPTFSNELTNIKRPILPLSGPREVDNSVKKQKDDKKTKREIRQMKNRESANKSRLRRKAHVVELDNQVKALTTKQNELNNIIAALRAENKSLLDQNAFLRSLIKSNVSPSIDDIDLESPNEQKLVSSTKRKRGNGTSTSTVGLAIAASLFGVTLLADTQDNIGNVMQVSSSRPTARILLALPPSEYPISTTFTWTDYFLEKCQFLFEMVRSNAFFPGFWCGLSIILLFVWIHHMWSCHIFSSIRKKKFDFCRTTSKKNSLWREIVSHKNEEEKMALPSLAKTNAKNSLSVPF